MNNFSRNTGKSAYYQPPMKKRGVSDLEDIEEKKSMSESINAVQPQSSQQNCPPPKPPQHSPQQPPQKPPHRPGQPNHRPPQPPHGRPPYRPNQRPSNRPAPQPQNSAAPDNEQLDRLVNTASKHLNTSPEELKNAAQNGNMQKLFSQMSPSQAQQLQKILSDENAAKKLLSTPQAQALLRGLSKNE